MSYYGSDLNRFIGEYCPHDFTTINVDCLCLKWERRILRVIEAKHNNEPVGKQQYKALRFLAQCLNNLEFKGWVFEVFITKGNHPYDTLLVQDILRNRSYKISGQANVIDWLSFKINLNDIAEETTIYETKLYQKLSI